MPPFERRHLPCAFLDSMNMRQRRISDEPDQSYQCANVRVKGSQALERDVQNKIKNLDAGSILYSTCLFISGYSAIASRIKTKLLSLY
jgi:hypothetical protein